MKRLFWPRRLVGIEASHVAFSPAWPWLGALGQERGPEPLPCASKSFLAWALSAIGRDANPGKVAEEVAAELECSFPSSKLGSWVEPALLGTSFDWHVKSSCLSEVRAGGARPGLQRRDPSREAIWQRRSGHLVRR
jgi:hypothetical protein